MNKPGKIELDTCPCCGSAAEMRKSYETSSAVGAIKTWFVICTNVECEIRTIRYLSPEKAASVWNRRVQP